MSFQLFLSENPAYFSGLWCSPGDLTKDDIADDLERPLKVVTGIINGFIVCISQVALLSQRGRAMFRVYQ